MRCCSLCLFLCVVLVAAPTHAATRCGWGDLERFVERAQRADAVALTDGQILAACRQPTKLAERAVQWLAFLYRITGDQPKSLRTDLPITLPRGMSQAAVLGRARAGAYNDLRQLIDTLTPGYATNPEAQLVLARAATRKGAFVRGRAAYRVYLGLNPQDEDAACEELYSWLWQGEFAEAEVQFRDALRYGGSVRLRGCLQRGLTLASARSGAQSSTGSARKSETASSLWNGAWRGEASLHRVPQMWQRQSLRVAHDGQLGMQLAGHELRLEALGKGVSRATEARLGGLYDYEQSLQLGTEVGFWSPGKKNTFGRADLTLKLPWAVQIATGIQREPLALTIPLIPDARGVMQDTIYLAGGVEPYATLRMALRREDDYSPHELHSLLLRWPMQRRGPQDFVRLRMPLTVERHPRPSPFYVADVKTESIGLGLELQRLVQRRLEIDVMADYRLASAIQRDPAATQSRYGILDIEIDLALRLPGECRVYLEGRYHRVDEEDIGVRRLLANEIGLGMTCAN